MSSFEDFMIDQAVKKADELTTIRSEVDHLHRVIETANRHRDEARSQVERLTGERDSAIARVHALEELGFDPRTRQLTQERDQALASCAMMREALEAIDKSLPAEVLECDGCLDKMIWAFTSTSGNSLLERLKEARELLGEVTAPEFPIGTAKLWIERRDTWLKGTP